MTLCILADDLTGACDTGSLFAGRGPIPIALWPDAPAPAAVCVVDTESRALGAAEAASRVATSARRAAARLYFKKIDSTLRGPVGPEIDAVLGATGLTTAVVCPAFPAQGRTVVDRVLRVDGCPVSETAIGRDPHFPVAPSTGSGSPDAGAARSSVVELLRPQIDRPLAWVPLSEVRAGDLELTSRLARLEGTIAVADAESDADLDRLVAAILALESAPLLVGSAGLGRALARRLGCLMERVALPDGARWLLVIGSRQPASRQQAAEARRAGMTVVEAPETAEADPHEVASRVAGEAVRLIDEGGFDLVAVTGGDTAVALYRALGGTGLELLGPPRAGLALGRLRRRDGSAISLLTKAGGFGASDLYVSLALEVAA